MNRSRNLAAFIATVLLATTTTVANSTLKAFFPGSMNRHVQTQRPNRHLGVILLLIDLGAFCYNPTLDDNRTGRPINLRKRFLSSVR